MSASVDIQHHPEEHRFFILWAKEQAELLYSLDPNSKKINFYRTYVPESARGKGLARQLVEAGLSWAKKQGYQIEASCSYVQPFLKN
ncbi:GNAT family N-acetyltransferase [Rheinheimera sp. 1928-s]|uniref:GNAT family N-acetyltransferase n=1 Tax=Rheinheimera sp. 1928-s TaxID=3033803 RepID=UPI00261D8B6C|nr:GNAT family N-acetyltransferase [Rheinheimera sp. 1928-s]MDF3125018.1 GNAT family N-acetyltransferase [Rheinheimera sp. 1928-s]